MNKSFELDSADRVRSETIFQFGNFWGLSKRFESRK